MKVEQVYSAVTTVPHGKKWVPSQMILIRQRLADGSIKKYKARLVAGGHRQHESTYHETSSPTAKPASVKLLYALAAIGRTILRTYDVKGAYLKSNIDEEIYMLLPVQKKGDKLQWVKLHKSIYGLKQAGLLWFQNIRDKLLKFGFKQCPDDECVFRYEDNGEIIDVVLYVDDMLTANSTTKIGDKFIKYLREQYGQVTEATSTSTHLGLRWLQLENKSIKISQPGYILKILTELKIANTKFPANPLPTNYVKMMGENKSENYSGTKRKLTSAGHQFLKKI